MVIRTHKKYDYFISKIEKNFDAYLLANGNISILDRWVSEKSDLITNLLTFLAAVATILTKEFINEEYVRTVLLATSLTNILKITNNFNITLKLFG